MLTAWGKRATTAAIALAAFGLGGMVDAGAQELKRGETVSDRPKDDYAPLGIRAGSFLVHPGAELRETFNSNIYTTSTNAKEDYITTLSPSLRVDSDWSRHSLNLTAGLDWINYLFHDDDSRTDYNVGASGRLDITRDTRVSAAASHKLQHEDRGSPDTAANAKEPTEYKLNTGEATASHKFNRISLAIDGKAEEYNFDDAKTIAGGSTNHDDRDRNVFTYGTRVGYEIQPNYEAFLRYSMNNVDYDTQFDDNGLNRDSDGYRVLGGMSVDLTGKLTGDIALGYMSQDYDDRRLQTVDGWTAAGSLRWNPTQLTTVTPVISRSVEETTSANYTGYVATSVSATVDHELLRNLLLSARVGYSQNEYMRQTGYTGKEKSEHVYDVGGGAKYKLNRNFYVGGRYDFSMKDAKDEASADYRVHKVMLKTGAEF